jgi:hypothetical protein
MRWGSRNPRERVLDGDPGVDYQRGDGSTWILLGLQGSTVNSRINEYVGRSI